MLKTIFIANWKMNKTIAEAQKFVEDFKNTNFQDDQEVVICPSFTLLSTLNQELKASKIKLGAQNMYFEETGAFTGEVSPNMLKELGCTYVILGHSERRQIFHETDELINKKVQAALAHDLTPVFCVGETLEQRENNQTAQIITEQIKQGLNNIQDFEKIVIAYEPVWAIGTGKVATPEQAQEVHALIRRLTNQNVPILYGGSVKPDNIKALMSQPDINGALVGGASLKVDDFKNIIN